LPSQISFFEQSTPSLQTVPFADIGCVQAPATQTSSVHGFASGVQAVRSGLFNTVQPPRPSQVTDCSHSPVAGQL
jgi:hypothetical protein